MNAAEEKFKELWKEIQEDTNARNKHKVASALRMLKFGGQSVPAKVREAGLKAAKGVVAGAAAGVVGAVAGPVAGTVLGGVVIGFGFSWVDEGLGIGDSYVAGGVSALMKMPGDKIVTKAGESAKKELEDLKKNSNEVIQRNVQKLNTAIKQAEKDITAFNQAMSARPVPGRLYGEWPEPTLKARHEKAYRALRASAEVWYYHLKVKRLVRQLEEAAETTRKALDQLDQKLGQEFSNLKSQTLQILEREEFQALL